MAAHTRFIKRFGKQWRVVDRSNKRVPISARTRDKIIWKAIGSDMYFHFSYRTPFVELRGNGWTRLVRDGRTLKLTVASTLPEGSVREHVYAVFCIGPKKYAQESTPPKIIIH